MSLVPKQIWWTAGEIAAAELPGLPRGQSSVTKVSNRLNWRAQPDFARRRKGRGGGWEYHWKLFPLEAQKRLLAEVSVKPTRPKMDRSLVWEWYDRLPQRDKDKAHRRLTIIQQVEALGDTHTGRDFAARQVGRMHGVTARTIWNWFAMIDGVRLDDRLPHLAPGYRMKKRGGPKRDCSPEFWDTLKSDYLRLEGPSFASCYRRAVRMGAANGWAILKKRTASRRLHAEVSKTTIILCRKGVDALKAMYPPQTRDKSHLHAMEWVNADYHKFDVFVRWPVEGSPGEYDIIRPQMVAFQDVYSARILSWRLDRTPNKVGVSLALGDMIDAFGIPDHILMDNGREFANKFLTGQTETRFRFKVKDDDIPGVLNALGIEVHWATPYSGQSKPIERAFRDLCDSVAKDPRLAGAYTGNRPDTKPENYGSRAIALEDFLAVVADGIEEHNTRAGRRSPTAKGGSFNETFDDSYVTAPIRKATPEQRRLWLMGAEGVKVDRNTALIRFMGNEYWSDWMHDIAGQKVVARFDPADLRTGLHLYSLDGAYLGHSECKVAAGFFDIEEARNHSAARRKWMKAEKAAAEAARRMKITDIADQMNITSPELTTPKEARVVRPVFDAPKQLQGPTERSDQEVAADQVVIKKFQDEKEKREAQKTGPYDRFRWALEIEEKLAQGAEVSPEEQHRLKQYQSSAEYRGNMIVYQEFGDAMFG